MNSVRKYITGNFIAMAITLLLCLVLSYWFKPAWSNLRIVTAVLFFVILIGAKNLFPAISSGILIPEIAVERHVREFLQEVHP